MNRLRESHWILFTWQFTPVRWFARKVQPSTGQPNLLVSNDEGVPCGRAMVNIPFLVTTVYMSMSLKAMRSLEYLATAREIAWVFFNNFFRCDPS